VSFWELSCNCEGAMLEFAGPLAGTSCFLSAPGARRRVEEAAGIQGNLWVYYRLPMS